MIITAAFVNGQSVTPKEITPATITVYQDRLDSVVCQGDRELYREQGATNREQDLCRDMARYLSEMVV